MLKISGVGTRKVRTYLLIILSVSLILRFCSVFLYKVPIEKDGARYDAIASNLVQGRGFSIEPGIPAFMVGPTYPAFLAFIYSIFGHSYLAVFIVQALLSTLTCFMIYLLGKEIANQKVGLLAALVTGIYPANVLTVSMIMSETFFTFLLVVMILLLTKAVRNKKNISFLSVGVTLGLLSLCKPAVLLYPLFLLVIIWIFYENKVQSLRLLIVMLAAFLLILTPWMIRNQIVFHNFVPVTTNGGRVLWFGNYPLADSSNWWPVTDMERLEKMRIEANEAARRLIEERQITDPVEIDKMFRREALKNILNNPFGFLKLCVSRVGIFWFSPLEGTYIIRAKSKALSLAWNLGKYLIVILAIVGIIKTRKDWKRLLPIFSLLVYFTVIHALIHSIRRFSYPLLPIASIFVAIGLLTCFNFIKTAAYRRTLKKTLSS